MQSAEAAGVWVGQQEFAKAPNVMFACMTVHSYVPFDLKSVPKRKPDGHNPAEKNSLQVCSPKEVMGFSGYLLPMHVAVLEYWVCVCDGPSEDCIHHILLIFS